MGAHLQDQGSYDSCQHSQIELDWGIMAWPSIDHSRDVLEQFNLLVKV